jgi:ribose/xylose/arabinose/galactoside ABC-type transport system permease subunit
MNKSTYKLQTNGGKATEKWLNPQNMRMYILLACIIVMMAGQVMVSPNIVKSGLSLYSYLVKCILTIESTALIACGVTFVIVCGKNDLSTGFLMHYRRWSAVCAGNHHPSRRGCLCRLG